MLGRSALYLITLCAALIFAALRANGAPDDAAIRQSIINQSIAAYPGRCPCPYNIMRNGAQCGSRSAWSKPGGYAPKCYPANITAAMVTEWRLTHASH